LCIPKVDEAISSKLADAYNTVSELRKISSVGVVDIQGLSEIARHSINTWFSNLDNLDMFDELARVVRVLPYENKTTRHTVVITGTMGLSRDKFTVKLLTNGYKVSKNLSKKTDYLVIGDNPSASKIALANELGIKIVTESDLILN
jgi:DNA ligase (NAD+)